MIRRPPRSTLDRSSAASDVYKRQTNNRVSSLMRQLEKSEWFANPVLKGVKANPDFGEQANDFDMTVTVTTPGAAAAQDESGE